MHIHPAIAALRGLPASQRRPLPSEPLSKVDKSAEALKAAREAWLATPQVQAAARDLARYGAGKPLAACPALAHCLGDWRAADTLINPLFQGMIGALQAHPLGEAPFRFKVSQGLATVQVLEAGSATLSVAAYEPLDMADAPGSALFSDREVHEIVLSGGAEGVVHTRAGENAIRSDTRTWSAGDTVSLRAQTQTRQVLRVKRSLLLLQLTREAAAPQPTRLVSLTSGATLRTASGDKSASQAVMALGVLGALGDQGALSVMEGSALNCEEDPEVRWEAARQTLGLSPARGLELLGALAARERNPLCAPAAALRAQLLEAQPELRALVDTEPSECH